MSSELNEAESQANMRLRALHRLTGKNGSHGARLNGSAALQALHDLASSPSTAQRRLSCFHELQVYQVELDMQDEELRRSRADLEMTLSRQVQLYDFAPVGCFTVDRSTALRELNLTATSMLGSERDRLLGRSLDSFLTPQSARALHVIAHGRERWRSDGGRRTGAVCAPAPRRAAFMPVLIATRAANTS